MPTLQTKQWHGDTRWCVRENDEGGHLPWPFKGEVRVQLLNQCEGGESFERAVVERSHATRDGYSTALACVTMGVEPECWGLPYFISHADLYKPEEGKEYLHEKRHSQV